MSSSAPAVVVVGTGFGCRIQIPALRAAGFDVVGLVGTELKRTHERASLNGVPAAFVDLDAAIEQTGAAAVAIASPPHTHGALTLSAAKRGCHILCEKPFARDSEEALRMLDAARRANVVHLIGHEFRLMPSWATFARAINDGLIGDPRFAALTSFTPMLVDRNVDLPDWWFDIGAGGGWLGAQGSHLIDWALGVFGDIDSLSGTLPTVSSRTHGAEDSYLFRFRTTSGVEGVLQQTTAAWGPSVDITRVAGTHGTLWMDRGEVFLADAAGVRTVPPDVSLALPSLPPLSNDPRYQTPKWKMLVPIELPPYVRLCEHFRALIERRNSPPAVPLATFVDGLACMRVIDAIRHSAAAGGALVRATRA